jgi:hypothetical protein
MAGPRLEATLRRHAKRREFIFLNINSCQPECSLRCGSQTGAFLTCAPRDRLQAIVIEYEGCLRGVANAGAFIGCSGAMRQFGMKSDT